MLNTVWLVFLFLVRTSACDSMPLCTVFTVPTLVVCDVYTEVLSIWGPLCGRVCGCLTSWLGVVTSSVWSVRVGVSVVGVVVVAFVVGVDFGLRVVCAIILPSQSCVL